MILADSREPKHLIHLISAQGRVCVTTLGVGDYIVGDVCIERKTISDFLSSLASGRLYDQVRRLSRAYSNRYLLIEGLIDWSTLSNPGWFCHALQQIVLMDVPVIFSQSAADSARVMARIAQLRPEIRPIPTRVKKTVSAQDAQLWVLCAIPGIGTARARKLLASCMSLQNVFLATKKELREAGLGRKTSSMVYDLARSRYNG